MTLRTLVVGLGQIGMGYDLALEPENYVLTHARACQEHPEFALVGGVDVDPARGAEFEQRYQRSWYVDLEKALTESRPDVVVIAAPTSRHGEVLRTVLDYAEPTAILCEKPLSLDVAEARAMVELCSGRCQLYVNYIRRSDPGVLEVKRRLDELSIGGPVKGVAWYSKGLLHNGSHLFNLLEFWLGGMEGFRMIDPGRLLGGDDPEPDVQVEFNMGIVTFLAAREEHFSQHAIELLAHNGRLSYERGGEQILWQQAVADPVIRGYTVLAPSAEIIGTGLARIQWHVNDQLAASLKGRRAAICTGGEALETLKNISRIASQR